MALSPLIAPVIFTLFPIAIGIGSIIYLRRKWRRSERIFKGYCPACGYDLAGRVTTTCPECGREFNSTDLRRLQRIHPYLLRARMDEGVRDP